MNDVKRYDVYGKELNDHDPDSEWFWVRKPDYDALAAENARLKQQLFEARNDVDRLHDLMRGEGPSDQPGAGGD